MALEDFPLSVLEAKDILQEEATKIPEKVLYLRGSLDFLQQKRVAVVGTRRAKRDSLRCSYLLGSWLAERGVCVVSGLARGVDEFAHKGALEKGITVGVLGTSADTTSFFPKENLPLAEKILEKGGALLSQFPSPTPGYPSNFPRRNLLIALLCEMIIVIEAPQRSGALITARLALKLQRKVLVWPGNLFEESFAGNRQLLEEGAEPLLSLKQLQNELGLKEKPLSFSLSPQEKEVLELIKKGYQSTEEILENTSLSPEEVWQALGSLELKGNIKRLGPDNFVIR